jgi:hypothetical protein
MTPLQRAAILSGNLRKPTWSWDLAARGVVPAGATFTRGSAGWYFNSAGVLVSASSNVARFDYDPATLSPLGYLAEMQSTNAVVNSRALTGAGWTANGTTVTDNAVVSPDGTTNAATLTETATTAAHGLDWLSTSIVSGQTYGISFFAKSISGTRTMQITTGAGGFINFDPATGATGSSFISIGSWSSISSRAVGNGWYRFSALLNSGSTGGFGFGIYMVPGIGSAQAQSYAGDGTSKIAVWGAQIETAGVGVTSYIPTAGSTVTRSQDILSLPLTSLPGWNASKGGVLVAAYRLHTSVPSGSQLGDISDGTSNNTIHTLRANAGGRRSLRRRASVLQRDRRGVATLPAVFVPISRLVGWGTPWRHRRNGTIQNTASRAALRCPQ